MNIENNIIVKCGSLGHIHKYHFGIKRWGYFHNPTHIKQPLKVKCRNRKQKENKVF